MDVDGRQFDQRRAWLDELMGLRHLWPWQVAQVLALAEELGVEVVIYDRPVDWNWETGRWTRRDGDGEEQGGGTA